MLINHIEFLKDIKDFQFVYQVKVSNPFVKYNFIQAYTLEDALKQVISKCEEIKVSEFPEKISGFDKIFTITAYREKTDDTGFIFYAVKTTEHFDWKRKKK